MARGKYYTEEEIKAATNLLNSPFSEGAKLIDLARYAQSLSLFKDRDPENVADFLSRVNSGYYDEAPEEEPLSDDNKLKLENLKLKQELDEANSQLGYIRDSILGTATCYQNGALKFNYSAIRQCMRVVFPQDYEVCAYTGQMTIDDLEV